MKQSVRSTIQRGKQRALYDAGTVEAILDSHFLCHVAVVVDGEARVLPTTYVRLGNSLYLHGHRRNAALQALCDGQSASICVTLLDGLVLARSAFHHSANYRSVVVFGRGSICEGDEKVRALDALVEHMIPGRVPYLRPTDEAEYAATLVIRFDIDEASAKVRTGPPVDRADDYELPIWAGHLQFASEVIMHGCPQLQSGVSAPDHVVNFAVPWKIG